MMEIISRSCNPTLNILLFGDASLNKEANDTIVETVQEYIMHTKRFV